MLEQTKPIAESNNFIILNKYTKEWELAGSYQSEDDLERDFIQDLRNQGYEFLPTLNNQDAMLANVRIQLQKLNNVEFTNDEWKRFVETYLDNPGDNSTDKTRKIHEDHIHDFVFDNGQIKNIYIVDKKNVTKNKLQVIKQFEQSGSHANRYDVTILVNGLPLIQIELKKRGVAIREAFNQVHRYSKESFNSENSLYKFIQLFVISNGTDTRYFANTLKRNKNSYDFTTNWAKSDNTLIKDLKDFTATFFQKNTLLKVILHYSVFDTSDTLLVMRPYQIAATERILWKMKSSYESKNWSKPEGGGYIWHTTGSGKTLTSFKAARMAVDFDFIDKVLFVVDRKDLDLQTMIEYKRFSPNSVNGSQSTAGLKENMAKDDTKIVVTTIQKLNNLMKNESSLPVYNKQVVFIFDECHRSQFGEAQKNLKKRFKRYYQFGFTGTPIFPENGLGAETTAGVFGSEIHSYVITDAIRDEKVLKFKVDYNDVRPKFKNFETEQNDKKLSAAENKEALQHPERIKEISKYILKNFRRKTHRLKGTSNGFNAMFAVNSIPSAKLYYKTINKLQKDSDKRLKIATIFSFAANEEQRAKGDIEDESFDDVSAMDISSKEFLTASIKEYNVLFKTNYSVDSKEFENYYKDLSKRVKSKEIDLLIVVGMFLTGFDAPLLNTLFVDKNLRYHGLIQAFSRTNRIYDCTKRFGNIVTFRDLEQSTIDAIKVFGDKNTKNVVLEKSYKEYMEGFKDIETGSAKRGYIEVVNELERKFPDPDTIEKESDKKEFAKLFGEYMQLENVLQNYDEFSSLRAIQDINLNEPDIVAEFKEEHHLTDDDLEKMKSIKMPADRSIQDYRSTYNDIRDWLRRERATNEQSNSNVDWAEVVFEVDLLKSQEINLDYILEQIFENNKKVKDKDALVENMRRMIRSSVGNRAKETLLVDFINKTDLDKLDNKSSVIEAFFDFARAEKKRELDELIDTEKLNEEPAIRYVTNSIKREFATDSGMELNELLPKMSPLNPQYLTKKQRVFQKVVAFVDKFKGVGG